MTLEAAAIFFSLTGTSLNESRSDFQLGNPPKSLSQVFGNWRFSEFWQCRRAISSNLLNIKVGRLGGLQKSENLPKACLNIPRWIQMVNKKRFNLREIFFLVLSVRFTPEPSDPLAQSRQR